MMVEGDERKAVTLPLLGECFFGLFFVFFPLLHRFRGISPSMTRPQGEVATCALLLLSPSKPSFHLPPLGQAARLSFLGRTQFLPLPQKELILGHVKVYLQLGGMRLAFHGSLYMLLPAELSPAVWSWALAEDNDFVILHSSFMAQANIRRL